MPLVIVDDIMMSTGDVNQNVYQEFKITSFTVDGLWLFLSKIEIDEMWSQVHISGTKFKDQFHTMHK